MAKNADNQSIVEDFRRQNPNFVKLASKHDENSSNETDLDG